MAAASRFPGMAARLSRWACVRGFSLLTTTSARRPAGVFFSQLAQVAHAAMVHRAGLPVMPRMGYGSGLFSHTF